MDVIHFQHALPRAWVQPVLALGKFDGVHRGHARFEIASAGRRRALLAAGGEYLVPASPPLIVRPTRPGRCS